MMTLLKSWRSILIALFAVLGLCLVTYLIGYSNGNMSGKTNVQLKWDREKSVQLEANLKSSEEARKKEQAYTEKIAQIDKEGLDKIKELQHEKDRIIDTLKRDNVRLSIAIKTNSTSGATQKDSTASVDHAETRAELSDEAFKFLAGEAERADKITVQLGACQRVVKLHGN